MCVCVCARARERACDFCFERVFSPPPPLTLHFPPSAPFISPLPCVRARARACVCVLGSASPSTPPSPSCRLSSSRSPTWYETHRYLLCCVILYYTICRQSMSTPIDLVYLDPLHLTTSPPTHTRPIPLRLSAPSPPTSPLAPPSSRRNGSAARRPVCRLYKRYVDK